MNFRCIAKLPVTVIKNIPCYFYNYQTAHFGIIHSGQLLSSLLLFHVDTILLTLYTIAIFLIICRKESEGLKIKNHQFLLSFIA